jgi:hypothetical protein
VHVIGYNFLQVCDAVDDNGDDVRTKKGLRDQVVQLKKGDHRNGRQSQESLVVLMVRQLHASVDMKQNNMRSTVGRN